VLKDQLRRDQARRQEGVICKGKGDKMCNRAEDGVVDFREEEYSAVHPVSLGSWLDESRGELTASVVCCVLYGEPISPPLQAHRALHGRDSAQLAGEHLRSRAHRLVSHQAQCHPLRRQDHH